MSPEMLSELAKQGITASIAVFLVYELVRDKRGFNKEVLKLLDSLARAVKVNKRKK